MSEEDILCSFCGRTKSQTKLLIAGLDAHICDICISQADMIVKDDETPLINTVKLINLAFDTHIASLAFNDFPIWVKNIRDDINALEDEPLKSRLNAYLTDIAPGIIGGNINEDTLTSLNALHQSLNETISELNSNSQRGEKGRRRIRTIDNLNTFTTFTQALESIFAPPAGAGAGSG